MGQVSSGPEPIERVADEPIGRVAGDADGYDTDTDTENDIGSSVPSFSSRASDSLSPEPEPSARISRDEPPPDRSGAGGKRATAPAARVLRKPSGPDRWTASFRSSTDSELRSLLVGPSAYGRDRGCGGDARGGAGEGGGDLSLLGREVVARASGIEEYRDLERALSSRGPVGQPTNGDTDATGNNRNHSSGSSNSSGTKAQTDRHNGNSKDASSDCFYKGSPANQPRANSSNNSSSSNNNNNHYHHEDHRPADNDELIELCVRILEASSSAPASLAPTTTTTRAPKIQQPPAPIRTLSRLRQKLVPSKLKEHVFWESLWVVLYDRKEARETEAFFRGAESSAAVASSVPVPEGGERPPRKQQTRPAAAPRSDRTTVPEEEPKRARESFAELEARYHAESRERARAEDLLRELWSMHKEHGTRRRPPLPKARAVRGSNDENSHGPGPYPNPSSEAGGSTPCDRCGSVRATAGRSGHNGTGDANNNNNNNNKEFETSPRGGSASGETTGPPLSRQQQQPQPQPQHTGEWILSKDSVEFLAFPSEAKEALRREKQKRLATVAEEMAFILDSDDPIDSRGEWSCCHKTNYSGDCGCVVLPA